MFPYLLTTDSISLFPVGKPPIVVPQSHPNFEAVVEAIKTGNFDAALDLANISTFVNRITAGRVSIDETGVYYNNTKITSYLANKMMQFFKDGFPVEPYCKFLDNLYDNPSRTAVEELYLFLEAANLPITEDGCFIAYKAIRNNWKDIHSNTFDNLPGTTHVMPRNAVDDNRNNVCSYGFHAAAYEYARSFMPSDGRLVAVKINPRDVVSVPADYNNQKLRTCAYTVLYEIPDAADILTNRHYQTSETFPQTSTTTFYDTIFDEADEETSFDEDSAEIPVGESESEYSKGFEAGYRAGLKDAGG